MSTRKVLTLGDRWHAKLVDLSVEQLSVVHEVSGEMLRDLLGSQLAQAHSESVNRRVFAMIPNTPPIPSELP